MELKISHVSFSEEWRMIQIGHCADIERLLEEVIAMYVRPLKELIERTVEKSL
jgi:hypothetical protein